MNRLAAGFLAGLLLFPQLAAAQPAPDTAPVRITLANGMHVILLPDKLAPVATSMMSYGVGADDDTMPGVAHATEHMLFRGTKSLSAGQLADIAARMGAEYNAFTANEYTLYYFKLPSAYVDVALHIESDRMQNALIREADWATERGAIQQEIRAQQSVPGYAIGMKLRQSFFKGMPFADAGGGTIPSFAKMQAADIRAFYHAWYQPSNATLIIAGDIDTTRTLAQIHTLFDPIGNTAVPTRAPMHVVPLATTQIQETMDFPIGFGALGYRLPGTSDPDYAATQVLSGVFDSGRGALADLSAQGKALAALSFANSFPEIGAAFLLAIPAQGGTPQSAQALLTGVIDGYVKNGVPADLIEAAKTRMLGERAFRMSSISGLGFAWAQANSEHRGSPDELYDAIQKVTVDDVNRVLRTYYTPEHQVSLIILPKPSSTMPKVDPNAGVENVSYTPGIHERLPAWAQFALKAPLRAPLDETGLTTSHLKNGLNLAVRRESAAPTIVLSAVIRNNPALYEPKGKDGVSLITQAMLGWGTSTYDRKAYQAQLDAIAATAKLGTTFSLRVQAKDFNRGMQLLADGLLNPSFAPAAFDVVKAQVSQGVGVQNNLPKTKANLAERLALYPRGDPRRRDVTVQTLAAVSLEDVKKYYRFAFRPDLTTIAIVGDVTPAQAQAAVQTYFGAWTARGPKPTFQYPHIQSKVTPSQTVTVRSSASVQSEVTLKQVFHMRRADPDYVPLLLANTILSGEGTGSLLFANLRTHYGYVYSVDSDVSLTHDGGEFSISFSSDPKDVNRANAAAIAIIKRLQKTPLPLVELQRAKALLLAQRVLPLDSYEGVASDMLDGARSGYFNRGSNRWFWLALLQTTPAQLQHAMQRIDADHFLRVIVAPDR